MLPEDYRGIESIRWMERRGNITKIVNNPHSPEEMEKARRAVIEMLKKHKEENGIHLPIPRVYVWPLNGRLAFAFYDERQNARLYLADWLEGRTKLYDFFK